MPFKIQSSIYIVLFLVVLLGACNVNELDFDDVKIPNYKPTVAAPIGEVAYTITDLIDELEDSTITIDIANSLLLSVIYRDTTFFQNDGEFVLVNDVTNSSSVSPGITLPPSIIDTVITISETFEFEFQPEEQEKVDSVFFSSGTIQLQVSSGFDPEVEFDLTLNDFVDTSNDMPLVFSGTVNGNGSVTLTEDITGFKTSFERINGVNIFDAGFEGRINVSTGQSINATDELTFQLIIQEPRFFSIFGNFGSESISLQDETIDLEIFSDIEEAGLSFNSPEILIRIDNSFGVPIGLNFDGLTAQNDNGTVLSLSGTITDTLQRVRAPEIAGESIGTTISINSDNSNLRDMLSLAPTSFSVPVSGTPNFEAQPGDDISNFLTDSSFVETIVEVNMPLDIQMNGFSRTFDFDLDNLEFKEADSITLRIQTINDLPFSGTIELSILNADSVINYQVPNTIVLQSPEVGADGRTVGALHHTDDIVFDSDGIEAFTNAELLGMILRIDSYEAVDGRFVQIYSNYKLEIKLSVLAKLNVKVE